MLFDQGYQRSRYELKYLVDEPCARQVRDFVRSYLTRDRHAIAEMRHAYPIYTIYLDDPGLTLYRATVQAQKNRFKLRVRYYDHDEHSPLFLEIKRRVNEVILKQRAIVRRDALEPLLRGECPLRDACFDADDAESYDVLREFGRLRNSLHAAPKLIVYFEREAWISPADANVRVTFDRAAKAARHVNTLRPSRWIDARVQQVILELKFDDRFPTWMRDLVECCDLHRSSMGKYAHCMDRMPPAAAPYAFVSA
jgi:SPX domain protein involved in polyphosphate accumulation